MISIKDFSFLKNIVSSKKKKKVFHKKNSWMEKILYQPKYFPILNN